MTPQQINTLRERFYNECTDDFHFSVDEYEKRVNKCPQEVFDFFLPYLSELKEERGDYVASDNAMSKVPCDAPVDSSIYYHQLLRDAYEWWHYELSLKENQRLIKKYYPNEKTGFPRFFMDTDKAIIFCKENYIPIPDEMIIKVKML